MISAKNVNQSSSFVQSNATKMGPQSQSKFENVGESESERESESEGEGEDYYESYATKLRGAVGAC